MNGICTNFSTKKKPPACKSQAVGREKRCGAKQFVLFALDDRSGWMKGYLWMRFRAGAAVVEECMPLGSVFSVFLADSL